MTGKFLRRLENCQLLAVLANGDLFTRAHLVRRDVYLAAIHLDMTMPYQLPGLTAGNAEAHTVDNVVQPAFELLQQDFAGHALGARGLLEVVAELPFLGKVHTLGLLLLAQLQTVAHNLGFSVFSVLTRSEVTLLDRAFIGEAFGALEEQLHALTAA